MLLYYAQQVSQPLQPILRMLDVAAQQLVQSPLFRQVERAIKPYLLVRSHEVTGMIWLCAAISKHTDLANQPLCCRLQLQLQTSH